MQAENGLGFGFCATGLLIGLMATWTGCGQALVSAEGMVTVDGERVDTGQVIFEPADGKGPVGAASIENGTYKLAGPIKVLPGRKIVRIMGTRKTGRKVESGPPSPPGTMVDEMQDCVPPIYNEKSTLTCELVAGNNNQHDFALESE